MAKRKLSKRVMNKKLTAEKEPAVKKSESKAIKALDKAKPSNKKK